MFRTYFPVLVLVCASVLWGLSWLPLKSLNALGIEGVPLLLVSHSILAVIFFLPSAKQFAMFKAHRGSLIAIGFLGGAAILCFTYALIYGDVIRVMVLFYLMPVWGVLGGILFLGEKPDTRRGLGVVFAIFGAFLILGGVEIFEQSLTWIDLSALMSGLFFAANNLCFRGVDKVPVTLKLFFMMIGCAFLSIILLAIGLQEFPSAIENTTWLWVLLYACTWSLCANLGSQWAVTQMETGRSSIIIIMELVAAVVSALIITDDRLTLLEWFGCGLVISAALLEGLRKEPQETALVQAPAA